MKKLLCIFALLLTSIPIASQTTIYVPENYSSISLANSAAVHGDTIVAAKSEYLVNLLKIQKEIRYLGA